MWATLKKSCPHAHSPNKCKFQPRNNIDQEAALASPHSAHHSQAPRQPAHRFPRGGKTFYRSSVQAASLMSDQPSLLALYDAPAGTVTVELHNAFPALLLAY